MDTVTIARKSKLVLPTLPMSLKEEMDLFDEYMRLVSELDWAVEYGVAPDNETRSREECAEHREALLIELHELIEESNRLKGGESE